MLHMQQHHPNNIERPLLLEQWVVWIVMYQTCDDTNACLAPCTALLQNIDHFHFLTGYLGVVI